MDWKPLGEIEDVYTIGEIEDVYTIGE